MGNLEGRFVYRGLREKKKKKKKKSKKKKKKKKGLSSTYSQARKLISRPSPTTKTRWLFFNRTHPRVVFCLLNGHNTLRTHIHLAWLTNSLLCRRCGAEEESAVHVWCECEALVSLRQAHLGYFFLDPEDIKILSMGAIRNFSKGTGLP